MFPYSQFLPIQWDSSLHIFPYVQIKPVLLIKCSLILFVRTIISKFTFNHYSVSAKHNLLSFKSAFLQIENPKHTNMVCNTAE